MEELFSYFYDWQTSNLQTRVPGVKKKKKKSVCFFFFFNSFVCSLHSKNVGVNLKKKKITLGCCITLANVVTFAVSPSCAPCCSLNSSGSLERVGKLVKRMMLVHLASFMA